MKLILLLLALDLKLKASLVTSSAFRKKARLKDFVLTIRTDKPWQARTFRLENGLVFSRPGPCRKADTELVWRDAGTAVKLMLSDDELDVFSAIGRTELRILGNFENALWFMELAD